MITEETPNNSLYLAYFLEEMNGPLLSLDRTDLKILDKQMGEFLIVN